MEAQTVIEFKPSDADMTMVVRKALENVKDSDIKLVFEKGTYKFLPDYAMDKYCFITNHGNGFKKIVFRFENFNAVEIEGNGSEFIFHGQVAPFQFENCKNISVKNLSIDWDIPFSFQGEVMAINEKEGWRDIKPSTEGFSWTLNNGKLNFPNIDDFHFFELGSTLSFDKNTKAVAHGAWDLNSNPRWVEKMPNGILRFHEPLKKYPAVGTILHSKGPHEQNRYAPAFQTINSSNANFNNVVVHHALGMGFLFERTSDINILNSGVYLKEGTDRVVSTIADATHFANCKGAILIENCRFENMLDDGTNVHGTYVEVDAILDEYTLRIALKHFEQMGFEFASVGDEIWYIENPSPKRAGENEVVKVKYINDKYSELTFKSKIPASLTKGDILENKTWNPEFTMRGNTIRNHRARNIIIKTPKKIVIEYNELSSMMSSILFRGETFFWYESGAVEDVLIRNNNFNYVAYSGSEHAVMYVTPRLNQSFDQTELFDKNIRFENNTIRTFDSRIIIADRVDGLKISGNTIIQDKTQGKALYPDAPIFDFINCNNVEVLNNTYQGDSENSILKDEKSSKTIKIKGNKGFKNLK
ncbi:right-handed parallel beta-helix repeat-containing protein [Mariniflexile sp. AS56]|uniref:alpha-1,3-galactosidase-related protein n=1 Tax=Mariniflexile sp. AS56 TaxID=3063957 RepID=UPI0026F228E4|nr:right-handed parallel beta-helix repeat-containing protein [Mariniflexile sp. AS56]MDO7173143.1 right-handed parallel beta-helix repeat-containing protein [Mariniflexile sp. AS56]